MRKIIIFLLCLLLNGCTSKVNVSELENKITELENKVTELKTSLSEMESEKNYLEGEVGRLEWVEYAMINPSVLEGEITDERYLGTFYDANKDMYYCFYPNGIYLMFNLKDNMLELIEDEVWKIDDNGYLVLSDFGQAMDYKCSFTETVMDCQPAYDYGFPIVFEKVQLKK